MYIGNLMCSESSLFSAVDWCIRSASGEANNIGNLMCSEPSLVSAVDCNDGSGPQQGLHADDPCLMWVCPFDSRRSLKLSVAPPIFKSSQNLR